MRRTDSPKVRWCSVGTYRAVFEQLADGARFAVHDKPERSSGYPRPRVIARGVIGGAGVVYDAISPTLEHELEDELVARWCALLQREWRHDGSR